MKTFAFLAVFSILLFFLVMMKRTYIAQLLGPAIAEPFAEKLDNMDSWLQPY